MATFLLSRPELGFADKYRTGQRAVGDGSTREAGNLVFTCSGAGSTTTAVGAAASLTASTNVPRIGEKVMIFTSAGVPKHDTVHTITAHNGTTTVTFSPAAASATASGDTLRLVASSPYADNDSLDAKLLANGYTQLQIDKLTQNDKVYAVRSIANPNSVK